MTAPRPPGALADRRGSTALEFGLVAPFLILLAVAFFEYGMRLAVQASLDFAAREASRAGITGAPPPAGMTRQDQLEGIARAAVMSFVDSKKVVVSMLSYGGYQNVGKAEPFIDLNGNGRWDQGEPFTDVNGNGRWDADQGTTGPGTSQQISVYLLSYTDTAISGLFPPVSYQARIVVHNEPYPN